MADRVSASIVLGGTMSAADYAELTELIALEGLSIEWDGEPFEPEHRNVGEPLSLCAHEVAFGRFEALEAWCREKRIVYSRWSGSYAGQWGGERVVFSGDGEPAWFAADEDDCVMIGRETAEKLGLMEAIRAHFDAADAKVPPLVVEGPLPEQPAT
ncbi:hypothetical protein [Sphingobium sp. CECT 9361]|uniref:hypothetical protein n=1 Tax=Sphingobium sp. CECT 9361 TaxID=2845384 RepID=UPI001E314170|nr:hypothetical protein [Sphingobium sp. CECT 9361]CAH0356311.1 hypothetical protein SPH9361_03998 [Sphingobium sp. CECT 9361]